MPSTIVVCILLMSADDNFSDIISTLFDNSLSKIFTFVFQFAVGIPIAFYIYGACYSAAKKSEFIKIPNDENIITELKSLRFLPSTAGFFSALPVCILYVIFFFSQITYFLSSFSSKLPKDMESYSEYARQGFFELCIVAVINLAIIITVNLFCKYNENAKRPFSISLITCILSAFTLILITTAVSKMIMYIDVYGLTLLRVYTTWFMILLAFVFIGIFLSVVSLRINLSKLVVIVFTIMFSLLSFCSIDGIIAKYNTERYLNGSLEYLNEDVFETLAPDSIKYSVNLIGKLNGKKSSNAELEAIIEAKATESQKKDLRTITIGDIIAAEIWEDYSD